MQKQRRMHDIKHWIEVPIELEMCSKFDPLKRKIEESKLTLPMPQSHIQTIELAAKQRGISYEQATLDAVQLFLEDTRRQFIETLPEKRQREVMVTITVSGNLTWIKKK